MKVSIIDSDGRPVLVTEPDHPKIDGLLRAGHTKIDSTPPDRTNKWLWDGVQWVVDTERMKERQERKNRIEKRLEDAKLAFAEFETAVDSRDPWNDSRIQAAMENIRTVLRANVSD